MHIEYFYYFLEAAERLSISKAARTYNITQQGLSRAIQKLEAEYGIPLFLRDGNCIQLTREGKSFVEKARELVSAHDCLVEDVNKRRQEQRDSSYSIDVLVNLNVAFNVWPHLSQLLQESLPDVVFRVREIPYEEIVTDLCLHPCTSTIALSTIPEIPENSFFPPALEYSKVIEMELMARVGRQSSLAHQSMISIEDILERSIAIHDDAALDAVLARLIPEYGTSGNITFVRTNNVHILDDTLRSFDSIGFSNSFASHYSTDSDFKILPLEKTIKTPVYLICNRPSNADDASVMVRNTMRDVIESNCLTR